MILEADNLAKTWPVQFSKVIFRNGIIGLYLGRCPITSRHRVASYKYQGQWTSPPEDEEQRGKLNYTVWLLDDCGHSINSSQPDQWDWLGGIEA